AAGEAASATASSIRSPHRNAPRNTHSFGTELVGGAEMNLSSHYESKRNRRWLSIIAAMVAAGLTAFAVYDGATSSETASAGPEASDTAKVEPIGKTGLKRVILTKSAAKRLDIQTAPVRQAVVSGKQRIVIPYSAVLYDPDGATWTYTSPKPLVFVRQ